MTDPRAWVRRWNEASLRQIAALRKADSSRWPLVGMFAMGLVVGGMGIYAVTQRTQIKRLASRAFGATREELGESGWVEAAKPVSAASSRENHRRKAVAEVTSS
jgi:hypothetical protein